MLQPSDESGTEGQRKTASIEDARAAPAASQAALQQANEQLLQSVALVQAIAETSRDVIYAKDLGGRMRHANPAALALIGKPLHQVLGRTDLEFLDDAAAAQQIPDNERLVLACGLPHEIEEHVPLPDGTPRVWLSLKSPYRDTQGRLAGLLGISRDITDRKRLEVERSQTLEQLQRSEERLRMALASVNAGMYDWDLVADRLVWDDRTREIMGVTADEPPSLRLFLQRHHASYRVVWRDGSVHWIDALGQVHFDAGPPRQARRFSGVLWDVTAQHELLQSLRDSDRHKNVFLATLAHELRNPLAPLRNAAQLLTAPALRADQLRWVQRLIERQVSHMARLLDDLLDLARITQGKLQLKKERVALGSIIEPAIEAARPLIEHKHHEFKVSFAEQGMGELVLEVDPVRLAQVVSNLLTNAAKYTDVGGHIELTVRRKADTLVVGVRDDGIGLPRDARSRIFEMFGQLDTGSTRAQGGLGIGLALVRGIVELHGGRVDVASAGPGQGSSFTVELPVAAPPPQLQAGADALPMPAGIKVLVADDNEDAAPPGPASTTT